MRRGLVVAVVAALCAVGVLGAPFLLAPQSTGSAVGALAPRAFVPFAPRNGMWASTTGSGGGTTSLDLIDQAEAAGQITAGQAATYRAQAIFADPALPAQFAAAPSSLAGLDPNGVLGAIVANWGSYDAQTQAALTPYLVRPNDPSSVFAQPARRAARRTGLDGSPRPGGVVPVGPAANGRILVWGQSATDPQALAVINILGSGGADNVLAPIEKLMGKNWPGDSSVGGWVGDKVRGGGSNQDDRLDVYVVPLAAGVTGTTQATGVPWGTPSFVLVNSGDSPSELEYDCWHELSHVEQYLFNVKDPWANTVWWMEQSASWSVSHFVPNNPYNYHNFVVTTDGTQPYFDAPDEQLDLWGGRAEQLHAYGGFLWPFMFDAEYSGGSGAAMVSIWKAMESTGTLAAIRGAIPDFATAWRTFTLANYNRPEVRRGKAGATYYGKWGTNPLPAYDGGQWGIPEKKIVPLDLTTAGAATPSHVEDDDVKPDLPHLSATYYRLSLKDDVHQVLFKLDNWTNQNGAGLMVLKRKKGQDWSTLNLDDIKDDWTKPDPNLPASTVSKNYRYFCRDLKDQDVDELLLVFSNSTDSDHLSATVPVELSNVACRWQGTVEMSERLALGPADIQTVDDENVTFDGVWVKQLNPLDGLTADPYPMAAADFPHAMPFGVDPAVQPAVTAVGHHSDYCGNGGFFAYTYQSSGQQEPNDSLLVIYGPAYKNVLFEWSQALYGTTTVTSNCPDNPEDPPNSGRFLPIESFSWLSNLVVTGRAPRFLDEAVFEPQNADPTPFGDVEHCLDTTRSVSDDGQSIDVTEHLSYAGSGDFPQCLGTGNDDYDFTYTVTIHLKGTPESTAARAAAKR